MGKHRGEYPYVIAAEKGWTLLPAPMAKKFPNYHFGRGHSHRGFYETHSFHLLEKEYDHLFGCPLCLEHNPLVPPRRATHSVMWDPRIDEDPIKVCSTHFDAVSALFWHLLERRGEL